MNKLDVYLREIESPTHSDYAGLVRKALLEFLHLSRDTVAPVENEVESEYKVSLDEAQQRFNQDKKEIDLYRSTQLSEAKSRLDAYAKTVRAEYERQVKAIETKARQKRDSIHQAMEAKKKALESERREKLMEVDFLAEGQAEKIRQAQRTAKSDLKNHQSELGIFRERIDLCMRDYRQPTVSWDAVDAGNGDESLEYETMHTSLDQQLSKLERSWVRRLSMGWIPAVWASIFVVLVMTGAALWKQQGVGMSWGLTLGVSAGIAIILAGGAVFGLLRKARSIGRGASQELIDAWCQTKLAADALFQSTIKELEKAAEDVKSEKASELRDIEEHFSNESKKVLEIEEKDLAAVEQNRKHALKVQMQRHNQSVEEAQQEYSRRKLVLDDQYQSDLKSFETQRDEAVTRAKTLYDEANKALVARWDQGIDAMSKLIQTIQVGHPELGDAWQVQEELNERDETSWVRFGTVELNLKQLADKVREQAGERLPDIAMVKVPVVLSFPDRCSVLFESGRVGRDRALDAVRAMMTRLFLGLPPGHARFTIIDPVGLGESFAGFMHAGDYLESLVSGRIWTEAQQIQQQLEDLTGHMENVIQKYLRNEFETIEDYNAQAGELAEPYRFLVIADFPTNFTEEAARRLSSVLHSGPRCGVHTLIVLDERLDLPTGIDREDLMAHSMVLAYQDDQFVWRDSTMQQFQLALDEPPAEDTLTELMHTVGRAGADSARVEVPFGTITPDENELWSLDSRKDIRVPLGRTGATRLQHLHLGKGMAQHMLIAGKTGSGKSTLLHVMVTNLALWYSPDEVELYLIDFKKGVEFKCYVANKLPHARAVAIESDREFGLSILQRLDAELTRRGHLFRKQGVQDIAAYRDATGEAMPRTILMVDEFQVFFAEDDKLAQDASILLEQLVRQGRAFGVHVVLGSQTLGGAFGLARSTMGQMAVRIALQCSEADSQMILDDDNLAARLLTRPGEAIYNDAGGQIVGNSPFQTAWLEDEIRDGYLAQVRARVDASQMPNSSMIVFEGSAPADIRENHLLAACLKNGSSSNESLRVWLGDPVAIKEPSAAVLMRQSGSNLLMVGQREDLAVNLLSATLVSAAAQASTDQLRVIVLDGTPPESPYAGRLEQIVEALPHDCKIVPWREVGTTITDLAGEADQRVESEERLAQTVLVIVHGLQRYRMLRRSEDSFGLSLDSDPTPQVDTRFADLLREGPAVGIHTVAWADTLATIERTLDRQTVREFDTRVLFQMSAADSSNLIDSPAANNLGFHRALLYSEEQGGEEKFRPYAALEQDWLAKLKEQLSK